MLEQTDIVDLHCFALECMPQVPVARRIRLLRTLAQIIGTADLARKLRGMADDLEAIEDRHQAVVLDSQGRSSKC